MQSIWKFVITEPETVVEAPSGATPLSCGVQAGTLVVWMVVNRERPACGHKFRFVGTGWDLVDDLGDFVGTVQIGGRVWHLFYGGKA